MTAKTTPNYQINFGWTLGEGPWDAGYNAWAKTFDTVVGASVKSDSVTVPPASPVNGDAYIVPTGATGVWVGKVKSIAAWIDSAWFFIVPKRGLRVEVQSASAFKYYNGTVWTAEPTGGGGGGAIPDDAPSDGTTYGRKNGSWSPAGGGGGATDLESLSDVLIATPDDGEVLTYNETSGKWENKPVPGGSSPDLDQLGDVEIATPADGEVLTFDETSGKWENKPASGGIDDAPNDGTLYGRKNVGWVAVPTGGGGSGTVTSVAMTLPSSVFAVTGSPITTSGTLGVSFANQPKNTLFAGPGVGADAVPTFRALVAADLPLATTAAFGAVKPDGTTVTITGGVISAVSGGGGGGGAPFSHRNMFIDGMLAQWNNGTVFPGIGATDTPTAGMWINNAGTGGAATVQQKSYMGSPDSLRNLGKSPIMPAFYAQHAQTTAASTAPTVGQKLEGVRTFAGESATLSVNLGSTEGVIITGVRITQHFGTGGSADVVTTKTVSWDTVTSQARFSVRLDIPTLVAKAVGTNGDDFLRIDLLMPTGATFHLDYGQWQIEQSEATSSSDTEGAGGAPTWFDHRSDAPSDDTIYGRKNGGWITVPGGGAAAIDRQNTFLNWIYQSKLFAGYRRGINLFADGYKAADGINAGSSSGYVLDTSGGNVSQTFAAGVDQTATHTSATQAGNVASASTELSGFAAWHAFNKITGAADSSSDWITGSGSTGWLKYQFSSAQIIGSYTVRSGNGSPSRSPKDWTLQGSNTGAFSGEQTTLDTRSAQTAWAASGEVRTYTISSPTSFLYYRLNITANNGDSFLEIDEVTYLGLGAASNAIVVSTAQTIPSSTTARALIEYGATAAPTLNTDLTVELSCNGGSNWTLATLTAAGAGQGGRQVAETVEVTCTAGTSLVSRIKTLNNKNIPIYGIAVSVK